MSCLALGKERGSRRGRRGHKYYKNFGNLKDKGPVTTFRKTQNQHRIPPPPTVLSDPGLHVQKYSISALYLGVRGAPVEKGRDK